MSQKDQQPFWTKRFLKTFYVLEDPIFLLILPNNTAEFKTILFADLNGEGQRMQCQNRRPVQGKEDPTSQEIDVWMPDWMLRPDTHAFERVIDRYV